MADKKQGEIASKRIALKPTTFERLRDFSRGLGVQYDDAIEFLLGRVIQQDEDDLMAGRRLRDQLEEDEDEEASIIVVLEETP